jgi:hypothetical protein
MKTFIIKFRTLIIILIPILLITGIVFSWYNKSIMDDIGYAEVNDNNKNIIINYNNQMLELKKLPLQFAGAFGLDFDEKIYFGDIDENTQKIKIYIREKCTLKIYYKNAETLIVVSERNGYPAKKHILTKTMNIDQEAFYILIENLYKDTGNEMFEQK